MLATIVWGANNTTIGYLVGVQHGNWPVLWTTGTRLLFAGLLLLGLLRWTRIFGERQTVPADVHRRLWLRLFLIHL